MRWNQDQLKIKTEEASLLQKAMRKFSQNVATKRKTKENHEKAMAELLNKIQKLVKELEQLRQEQDDELSLMMLEWFEREIQGKCRDCKANVKVVVDRETGASKMVMDQDGPSDRCACDKVGKTSKKSARSEPAVDATANTEEKAVTSKPRRAKKKRLGDEDDNEDEEQEARALPKGAKRKRKRLLKIDALVDEEMLTPQKENGVGRTKKTGKNVGKTVQ